MKSILILEVATDLAQSSNEYSFRQITLSLQLELGYAQDALYLEYVQ
ncbi:hypothetical protein [Nostoc sp.]